MLIVTLDNCTELSYDELKLSYEFRTGKFFRVCDDMVVLLSWGEVIVIEAGFKTDLASVPRWLWSVCPPYGDFLMAAIIHDWLYINNRARTTTRKQADQEMLIWSEALDSNKGRAKTYHTAVRLFGGSWWNHDHQWK